MFFIIPFSIAVCTWCPSFNGGPESNLFTAYINYGKPELLIFLILFLAQGITLIIGPVSIFVKKKKLFYITEIPAFGISIFMVVGTVAYYGYYGSNGVAFMIYSVIFQSLCVAAIAVLLLKQLAPIVLKALKKELTKYAV